ncbi:hypothetical protein ILP97_26325 [Amycolatopsis sp. H6(2020)]|nr:hypothetical protein [Amycolatopsis sp. H6(2020)]
MPMVIVQPAEPSARESFLDHLDDPGGRQLLSAEPARRRQVEEPGFADPLDQVAGQGL